MRTTFNIAKTALLASCICITTLFSASLLAQDQYPSKPITLVVPYPPGGSNDVFARSIAKELSDLLKQPVVVENRAGASGITGTSAVVRAAPDGYTLVAVSSSMTTTAAIHPRMPFDPVKDLAAVAMLAEGPFLVAVTSTFPAKNPTELIAAIRGNPGAYNYASSGTGSVNQFGTELLKAKAGNFFITHIPYRGMAPALNDLVSGQVQVLMASGPSMLPMIRAGRVRAIGVTSLKQSPIAPELTPMSTAVPGYEFSLWWGILAPSATPPAIVAKLNAAINQALAKPAIKAQFLNEGAEVKALTPAQFGSVVAGDIDRWKKLARQQNISAE